MSNGGTKITCDTEVILSKFGKLDVRSMTKVHKAAFSNANKVLMKEARLQLQGVTARATTGLTARRKGWAKMASSRRREYGSLERGIRSRVSANGDRGMVHIMGDFRLKWFEMGTTNRYRSGDVYTGRMTATRFFAKSVSTAERSMTDAFENTVVKAVERRVK